MSVYSTVEEPSFRAWQFQYKSRLGSQIKQIRSPNESFLVSLTVSVYICTITSLLGSQIKNLKSQRTSFRSAWQCQCTARWGWRWRDSFRFASLTHRWTCWRWWWWWWFIWSPKKDSFFSLSGSSPQRALSILENRSSRIFGMTISNLCLWPKKWHFLKKDVGDGVYADHTDDYDQRYEQVSPRFSLHISFAIVGFSILINISR